VNPIESEALLSNSIRAAIHRARIESFITFAQVVGILELEKCIVVEEALSDGEDDEFEKGSGKEFNPNVWN